LTPIKGPCPAWLEFDRDEKRYRPIPDRVDTIKLIFHESLNGIGGHALVKRLNQRNIGNISESKRKRKLQTKTSGNWHRSYIEKILTNKAVIGEFQPHKIAGGKRVEDGPPIKNYFPPIIDEKLFYRVKNCREERRNKRPGRKGQNLTNLFTGLATCAYCGARMILENKGPPPKGGRYLACSAARRGLGCITRPVREIVPHIRP
jgi:hypothetical protein